MERTSKQSTGLRTSLATWVLGFLGITALVKFLPRAVSYAIRRWLFGLVAEIVVVVVAALLTEKLADRVASRNGRMHTPHAEPTSTSSRQQPPA